MAQKKSYSRYFIILQQDENGYSLASDKLPSGYTKLETKNDKCKISYYVQNLKKELEPYELVLICSKKEMRKLVNLGNMTVDEYGRAEVSFEYNAANIANTSIPIEMVTGAAVIKHSNNKDMHSIMSGFITNDAPRDWKNFKSLSVEENKTNLPDKTASAASKTGQNSIFDEYEKNIDTSKKVESSKEVINKTEEKEANSEIHEKSTQDQTGEIQKQQEHEEDKKVIEVNEEEVIRESQEKDEKDEKEEKENVRETEAEVVKEVEDKVDENIISEQSHNEKEVREVDGDSQTVEQEKKESQIDKETFEDKEEKEISEPRKSSKSKPKVTVTKGTLEKFFDDIAKDFEKVENVCEDIKRCDWYRVNVKSLEDMCDASDYNKYTVVYYPMISYYPYIKKHEHFLVGYKHDMFGNVKYLVYGIPGLKSINDQPYAGRSGFVTWAINDDKREAADELGYWLMFYDFRNSTIVIPVQ